MLIESIYSKIQLFQTKSEVTDTLSGRVLSVQEPQQQGPNAHKCH